MRTFDYRHLSPRLFDGEIGDVNALLNQDKGKLELLEQLHPEQLEPFRTRAHFDNVDASTRIEGLYVDQERVRALIAGSEPTDETEAQIVGYSNALRLVEEQAQQLDLTTATILQFYETLYAHRNLGRKSRYRKKDYMYVQVDGHAQAMPVSPITAFETPLVLGGACDSLADSFAIDHRSPLVLASVFTVDFLCIRPFDEGNGRVSRLFADLMLAKAGFNVSRYVSVERIIENSAMAYYDALNNCVDKWDKSANDYTPFARYWLDVIHQAYLELFDKVSLGMSSNNSKTERVRLFIQRSDGGITKRQLVEKFPDISEATIENVLGKMVKDGELVKVGAGRSTSYVRA